MNRTGPLLKRLSALAAITGVVALLVGWTADPVRRDKPYHTPEELDDLRGGGGLPVGTNTWFLGSGQCEGCHGHDFQGFGMVTPDGTDVNVVDDWRSSMMANSAHDPFWRAKVSHEVLVNPAHQVQLEDKCTSCHAAQGRYDKYLTGQGPYSIAEMVNDPVALDGVSCMVCHRQSQDSIGLFNSGRLKFDPQYNLYGPYSDNIFGAPMTAFVGYVPEFGVQINDAGLCAGCHTLITETADLSGNPSGDEFVEQATYHEWLNSDFNTEEHVDGITCQGCHVPRINDGVVLSANYIFLQPRSPFGLHHLAGGNAFMLKMLRDHAGQLGLTANDVQFDSTIARTMRNLQQQSILLDATVAARNADTAFINVKLTNLTGHKFPSGYPSRRAWVQLVVVNTSNGDTLFNSGAWNGNYEVVDHPATFAPHYDVITSSSETQIYEMVMGDVNGNKTTVLERAKDPLKDDRLAPLGFSTAHYTYDTTTIAGVPSTDVDFNRDDMGVEGSGTDVVHYHAPMGGYTGEIQIHARAWYQSVPPLWNAEMFAHTSAEIDSFKTMYEAADNSPILVKETSLTDLTVDIDDIAELGVHVFPNPVSDGMLNILGLSPRVREVEVFDVRGRLVHRAAVAGERRMQLPMPDGPGSYLVVFVTEGRVFPTKVVVQ